MFESVMIAIVSKIVAHMFDQHILKSTDFIDIQNAPTWYMQEKDRDKYYIFRYSKGTIASIDKNKVVLKSKMVQKIKQDMNSVINQDENMEFYKKYQNTIVEYVGSVDVSSFVDTKMQIPHIKYKADKQEIWLGGYIVKDDFSDFLNEHMKELELELSNKKLKDKINKLRNKS